MYATNIWDTPGIAVLFEFNFAGGYLSPAHIRVEVEDKLTRNRVAAPFTLLNAHTVKLNSPAPAGTNLWIYRKTPVNAPLADFTAGTRVTPESLDIATQQAVFAMAEMYDRVALGEVGQGFTAAHQEVSTTATAGQTTFPAPMYMAYDHVVVTVNQLRVHSADVTRVGTNFVTIPAVSAGDVVQVEVTRISPNPGGAPASPPVVPVVYDGANIGPGYGVYAYRSGSVLNFKSLRAGPNVTLEDEGDAILVSTTAPPASGGGSAPPSSLVLGDFVMNHDTPNQRVEFPTTNPTTWNTGPGTQTLTFDFTPVRYFEANPNGHIAIVGRCDTSLLMTIVSGQGMVIGKVTGDLGNASLYTPTSSIETWNKPNGGSVRWVFPDTSGGPGAIMKDGTLYRFILETTKAYDGTRYIRYRRYSRNTAWNAWDMDIDTGHVLDTNTNADLTKDGVAFGHVGEGNLVPWSAQFTNVKVVWGPPTSGADTRGLFSKFGGRLSGDIHMDGPGRQIIIQSSGTPAQWTRLIEATAADTKVLAAPNLPSGTAAFIATNSNDRLNSGFLSMAAYPTYASIHCDKIGTGARPTELRVSLDGTTKGLIFTPAGTYVHGASQPLGKETSILGAITGAGGYNSIYLTNNSPFDLENPCAVNGIKNFLVANGFAAAQAGGIEGILRPLYAIVSVMLMSARSKGTM